MLFVVSMIMFGFGAFYAGYNLCRYRYLKNCAKYAALNPGDRLRFVGISVKEMVKLCPNLF